MLNETDPVSSFDSLKFIFNSIDYAVFTIMLGISAAIGVYFGFFANSANTTDEYLLGGKKMKIIPIAVSLVASQLSAIAILTIPSEVYQFGIHYIVFVGSMFFVLPILLYVIIPVFYNNNISNCYEYLEMRFDKKIRRLVTIAFVIQVYLLIPIYIFTPSLAFSQVTGFNLHLINGIVCSICVFYTMVGGIKAVVWTDVVQGSIMLGSVMLVAVLAIIKVGGLHEVISRAEHGNRIHKFDMTFGLTERSTFWNHFLGGFTMWICHIGVNQSCVQRIVALPSLHRAKISLLIFALFFFIIMGLTCFTGIVMYARYYLCDPIAAGLVAKADKLVPFFVQDVVGSFKGLPGIFISCVFSAALSTMSANLNTLAGLVYFDYIRPFVEHTESRANIIMKILVVISGVYCIAGGFVVEQFTSILQIAITISGMTQGAIAGVFLLGMLYPKANAKAAFISTITSMLIMAVIVIGTQIQQQRGILVYDAMPTHTEGCIDDFNITISNTVMRNISSTTYNENIALSIFKISFYWYTFFGCILVWIFGLPLSYLLKNKDDPKIDINLFSPVIHCLLDEYSPKEEKPLRT